MLRKILCICAVLTLVFLLGCNEVKDTSAAKSSYQDTGVTIVDKGNYYDVSLDFNSGLTHRQMGEAFGKGILELVPNYEALVDSYISENLSEDFYNHALPVAKDIKAQLEKDYADEIEGISAVFSGGEENKRKDNKLSKDEFFLFNLFPDAARSAQCSFVSVFGERSSTGSTIAARNLDWFGGSNNQLPKIQAVITFKNAKSKVCSIGFLGYMGIITGFNDSKVFAAILDSQSYEPFVSESRRSYPLDLRYALENNSTLKGAAEFMKSNAFKYTVNHLIAFSDPKESKVLENNFSGKGPDGQNVRPELRSYDSRLNDGVLWGMSKAIGSVNSFLLYGNLDNHTQSVLNTTRWDNMRVELLSKGDIVTPDNLREVITYNHGSPGAFLDSGDLYNKMTLHTVVFEPEELSLEVFFRPRNTRKNPVKPVFEKIMVFN